MMPTQRKTTKKKLASAPGYVIAKKKIIKFIICISVVVINDKDTKKHIKVICFPNYSENSYPGRGH